MHRRKCMQHSLQRPFGAQIVEQQARLRHGHKMHRVGQFIRQGQHGSEDGFVPLHRTGDGQRCCAAHGIHRLQETRQAQDVISMVMGQGNQVDLHRAQVLPVERQLRALAAIQQNMPPVNGEDRAAQGPVRLGQGGGSAKKRHSQHRQASRKSLTVLYHIFPRMKTAIHHEVIIAGYANPAK